MSTPIPQKYKKPPKKKPANRPRLKLTLYGYLVAWLAPNIVMAGIVVLLNLLPVSDAVGDLAPLLTLVGLSGLIIGLPLSFLVTYLFRHQLNQAIHIMGFALIGMLYGLIVLVEGLEGLVPLLIPLVGFPAAILMALGRWAASPFTEVVEEV